MTLHLLAFLQHAVKSQEESHPLPRALPGQGCLWCEGSKRLRDSQMIQGIHREPAIVRVFHWRFWRPNVCFDLMFQDSTWLRDFILPWGAASVSGCARSEQAKQALELYRRSGGAPDDRAFVAALKACASKGELTRGRVIHAQVLETGFQSNVFVANTLIHMYAKCGCLQDARKVFDGLSTRDLVSWNAIIAGYAQLDHGQQALQLFRQMQGEGMHPDRVTFLSVLKACGDMDEVSQVHAKLSDSGLDFEVRVGNSLINVYARCGSCEEARGVFDRLSNRDVVSWNAMIAGYVSNGQADDAVRMFWQMQQAGWQADKVTLISSLKACSGLAALDQGKLLHAIVKKCGFESDVCVGSTLIDLYIKCGSLEDAQDVFHTLPRKDHVPWTQLIAGYAQEGNYEASIKLYERMQVEGLQADAVTVVSILKGCSIAGAFEQGKLIHAHVEKNSLDSNAFVCCSLIDMYVSCGSLVDARLVFDRLTTRNLVTWNTMITGYAHEGDGQEAIQLYKEMQLEGIHPDQVTLTSVLKACSSISALAEGRLIHSLVVTCKYDPDVFIGNTLIDMYCKCGSLDDARRVFDSLSSRNLVTWNAMITGYAQHGCTQEALSLFQEMQQEAIHPNKVTFVSLLSACSHAGAVDQGIHLFQVMSKGFLIAPEMDHFACIVDLLGRAGYLTEAEDFISKMPLQPDTTIWHSMLGACQTHGMTEIGRRCFQSLQKLDPAIGSAYVTMSNIYAASGSWESKAALRREMEGAGVRKDPGCTWMEVQNKVHCFKVNDRDHLQRDHIHAMVKRLDESRRTFPAVAQELL